MKRTAFFVLIAITIFAIYSCREEEKIHDIENEYTSINAFQLVGADLAQLATDLEEQYIDSLRKIEDEVFSPETVFKKILTETIGKEAFTKYYDKIKEKAAKSAPTNLFDSIPEGIDKYDINRYLIMGRKELRLFCELKEQKMLDIKRVFVPENDVVVEDNVFIKNAIAEKVKGRYVVTALRKTGYRPSDENQESGKFIAVSDDEGKTWKYRDNAEFNPYGYKLDEMPCMGKFGDKIIMKDKGTIVSEDGGKTWNAYPLAFKGLNASEFSEVGPDILNHPKFGLLFFSNIYEEKYPGHIFCSKDEGKTWEHEIWKTNDTLDHEPPTALTMKDGSMVMLAVESGRIYQYTYKYKKEDGDDFRNIEWQFAQTTIRGRERGFYNAPDIIYNPFTRRIEAIECSPAYLQIWDIDPAELFKDRPESGRFTKVKWTPKCKILQRDLPGNFLYGMYSAGSVVDLENKMQHIFIVAGTKKPSRNGIYMVSRNLMTTALDVFVTSKRRALNAL